jgi:hypothetical protein
MIESALDEPVSGAGRDTICDWLAASGVSMHTAERWCDAWESEAAILGLSRNADYWTLGQEWITEQRRARRLGWA